MIEKLELKKGNYIPCEEVIFYINEKKAMSGTGIVVGEVGVDIGATAVEVISILDEKSEYYYFDFEHKINELEKDFETINQNNAKLFGYGNTNKTYDSYSWNLVKLYKEWDEKYGDVKRFDVVYLDGAHTFLHDSSACCILKEMMKVGGYLIFDDIRWSIANSPTVNPKINKSILDKYPIEQINACQVQYVTEIFMDTDERYQFILSEDKNIGVYKRIK